MVANPTWYSGILSPIIIALGCAYWNVWIPVFVEGTWSRICTSNEFALTLVACIHLPLIGSDSLGYNLVPPEA